MLKAVSFVLDKNKNGSLFFLIFGFLLLRVLFTDFLLVNEADVLPVAKQFMNHKWLSADWYLNQDIGYRVFFNFLVGSLLRWMSFPVGALIGRILVIILWAILLLGYVKEFKIQALLVIPLLWFFTEEQNVIAGEWMLMGLETKTFSYLTLMAAFLMFHRKRYRVTALLLGLSVSFHVLVGGFGTIALLMLWVFHGRELKVDRWTLVLFFAIYLVAAAVGLYAIFQNILTVQDVDKTRAGLIYVHSRIPHHVLPSYWFQRSGLWKPLTKLVLCLVVIVPVAFKPWNRLSKLLARYALLSLLFVAAGFIFQTVNRSDLLKYYPFRLSDVLLPFAAYFLFFSYVSRPDVTDCSALLRSTKVWAGRGISVVLLGFTLLTFIGNLSLFISDPAFYLYRAERGDERREVYSWVKENTPRDSIFLIPPFEERFYVSAERPQFVSFKHSPQSEGQIIEWYKRLVLISGKVPDGKSFTLNHDEIRQGYNSLTPETLALLAEKYGIDYYIAQNKQEIPYPVEFNSGSLAVYKLK